MQSLASADGRQANFSGSVERNEKKNISSEKRGFKKNRKNQEKKKEFAKTVTAGEGPLEGAVVLVKVGKEFNEALATLGAGLARTGTTTGTPKKEAQLITAWYTL